MADVREEELLALLFVAAAELDQLSDLPVQPSKPRHLVAL
jgi:hypothetical protein